MTTPGFIVLGGNGFPQELQESSRARKAVGGPVLGDAHHEGPVQVFETEADAYAAIGRTVAYECDRFLSITRYMVAYRVVALA